MSFAAVVTGLTLDCWGYAIDAYRRSDARPGREPADLQSLRWLVRVFLTQKWTVQHTGTVKHSKPEHDPSGDFGTVLIGAEKSCTDHVSGQSICDSTVVGN